MVDEGTGAGLVKEDSTLFYYYVVACMQFRRLQTELEDEFGSDVDVVSAEKLKETKNNERFLYSNHNAVL